MVSHQTYESIKFESIMRVSNLYMSKYSNNESFFFCQPFLNICFLKNVPVSQPNRVNLIQAGKYFVYEREEVIFFSPLKQENGKITGKLFSCEHTLRKNPREVIKFL